jgi:hypothetical protein
VTGEPNALVAPIHNRMPVILRLQDYGTWLGEKPADAEALSAACAPIPAEAMRAYSISTRVNSARNDDPLSHCCERIHVSARRQAKGAASRSCECSEVAMLLGTYRI